MIPTECSYCGDINCQFVKTKTIEKFSALKLISARSPICGPCFLKIKNGHLSVSVTLKEMELTKRAAVIKSAANNLSKQTPLHKINELCDELEEMKKVKKLADYEFEARARDAQAAAQKVEWIRNCIDEAMVIVARKMQTSYEVCRKVASQCCSDINVRNAVFERDGFKCKICGLDENLSIDHILSVRLGGNNELDNLQTLCLPCNVKKGWRQDTRNLKKVRFE